MQFCYVDTYLCDISIAVSLLPLAKSKKQVRGDISRYLLKDIFLQDLGRISSSNLVQPPGPVSLSSFLVSLWYSWSANGSPAACRRPFYHAQRLTVHMLTVRMLTRRMLSSHMVSNPPLHTKKGYPILEIFIRLLRKKSKYLLVFSNSSLLF